MIILRYGAVEHGLNVVWSAIASSPRSRSTSFSTVSIVFHHASQCNGASHSADMTYSSIHAFPKPPLPDVPQRGSQAVRPDEVLDIKGFTRLGRICSTIGVGDRRIDGALDEQHLADVSHFEHLSIVEGLLSFNDGREIDEFGIVRCFTDVEYSPS